jgi:hypothetical protein
MPVDTGKVRDRRKVSFTTLQDILTDAERLSGGPIKTLGNRSPGQIFSHLARAMNESIDGSSVKVAWYIRLLVGLMRKKMLAGPMPPGFKLPPDAEKALWPGPTSTQEGLTALKQAIARLERDPHRAPSPVFGPMTKDEWNQLHLNHAALHLSFLAPQN